MSKKNKNKGEVQNSTHLQQFNLSNFLPYRTDGAEKKSINHEVNQEFITNDRFLIARLWQKDWIAKKIIELPVNDAFKELPILKTELATQEQNEEVLRYFKRNLEPSLLSLFYITRAYGSGALIIDTGNSSQEALLKPLMEKEIKNNKNLKFIPVDLWNLIDNEAINRSFGFSQQTQEATKTLNQEIRYSFNGIRIHRSRVIRLQNGEPDINTLQFLHLKGGLSIFEPAYTTFDKKAVMDRLIIELTGEAKTDVIKMKGLTELQASPSYQSSLETTMRNKLEGKNSHSTLILDGDTEYEQKTIGLGGLDGLLTFFQMQILQASGIPPKRIAGLNANGFADSDKTVEEFYNRDLRIMQSWGYNAYLLLIQYTYSILFGFVPSDLEIEFGALDSPSAEISQALSTQKLDNILKLKDFLPREKLIELMNQEKVFSNDLDVSQFVENLES